MRLCSTRVVELYEGYTGYFVYNPKPIALNRLSVGSLTGGVKSLQQSKK